jgi:hypothetical protein
LEQDIRWHHGQTLAAGQVAEFKVWAELVRQSMGGLHIFLPLRDTGIDGVVHRLSDGAYMPVQVKARTSLTPAGQVHITVTASSLVDDDALVVATLLDAEELGRFVLVVDEAQFRALAVHDLVEGKEYLTAAFQMHSGGDSRWAPYLVDRDRLAERFGSAAELGEARPQAAAGVDRGHEGFLGEMEVVRRLAEAESLNLFRPFPDGGGARAACCDAPVPGAAGQGGRVGPGTPREPGLREAIEFSVVAVDLSMCRRVESRRGAFRRRLPAHSERRAHGHRQGGRGMDHAGAGAGGHEAPADGPLSSVSLVARKVGGVSTGLTVRRVWR